jgi:hypothetical protein
LFRAVAFARIGRHGLAIAVVTAALIGGSFSRSAAAVQPAPDDEQTLSSQPAQLALPIDSSVASAPQLAEQSVATVTFDPRVGLPQWLRAVKDTSLWASGDSATSSASPLPAYTSYVKPLGPFNDGRIEVYFPGLDRYRRR